jgi:hypothetical protein
VRELASDRPVLNEVPLGYVLIGQSKKQHREDECSSSSGDEPHRNQAQ